MHAAQAIRSEITRDSGGLVYVYQPLTDYIGRDDVVILLSYSKGDARFR